MNGVGALYTEYGDKKNSLHKTNETQWAKIGKKVQ